jgi:hypothetical protein
MIATAHTSILSVKKCAVSRRTESLLVDVAGISIMDRLLIGTSR